MNIVGKTWWFVTTPRYLSETIDICFECDLESIMLQTLGGLMPGSIVGMYNNPEEALAHAKQLLKERDQKLLTQFQE